MERAIENQAIEQMEIQDLLKLYLYQFRTGTDCFIAILNLMGFNDRELAEYEFGVGRSAINKRLVEGRKRFIAAVKEIGFVAN